MNRHRIHWLAETLLAVVLLLPCRSLHASEWLENVSVLVRVGDEASATGHVYDSEDYQRMLLVMDGRPIAAILDLVTATVSAIPQDSIKQLENGCVTTGTVEEDYLATLHQNEGTLEFDWENVPVRIEPLPPLIGKTDLKTILAMKPSYGTMAESYRPDTTKIVLLRSIGVDTEIRVYFGTWCHICRRLVPPLIGTLRRVGNPKLRVEYIGVDEDLTEPAGEIDKYAVGKTPTVIVLQGGQEIGRIEEEASSSVETDLVDILFPR